MSGRMAVSPPSRAQSAWMQPAVIPSTICSSRSRIVLGHGDVVEEEERLGPAAQGVVDAHGHQVDADRIVAAQGHGHLELRAHAVGARDQHGVFVMPGEKLVGEIELEKAGKPAFQGDYAGGIGPRQQPRQPGHGLAIDFQIDARVLVRSFGHDGPIVAGKKADEKDKRLRNRANQFTKCNVC